jgi:hypothetical protein
MYSRLCAYAALGRAMLTIAVFRDLDKAEEWLTTQAIGGALRQWSARISSKQPG